MPMWRCPHCGTPQAETARCWVCRRSSTACGTCRSFRRSVAGSLGYCGLDRHRRPLVGDEIRPCWEAAPAGSDHALGPLITLDPVAAGPSAPQPTARLDFVEVRDGASPAPTRASTGEVVESPPVRVLPPGDPGWSLWGELDA